MKTENRRGNGTVTPQGGHTKASGVPDGTQEPATIAKVGYKWNGHWSDTTHDKWIIVPDTLRARMDGAPVQTAPL